MNKLAETQELIAFPEWTEYRKKNGLDPLGMQNSSVNLYQSLRRCQGKREDSTPPLERKLRAFFTQSCSCRSDVRVTMLLGIVSQSSYLWQGISQVKPMRVHNIGNDIVVWQASEEHEIRSHDLRLGVFLVGDAERFWAGTARVTIPTDAVGSLKLNQKGVVLPVGPEHFVSTRSDRRLDHLPRLRTDSGEGFGNASALLVAAFPRSTYTMLLCKTQRSQQGKASLNFSTQWLGSWLDRLVDKSDGDQSRDSILLSDATVFMNCTASGGLICVAS